MAIIQRPPKQGAATTYQGKVALGYTDILASEMDADLDTIYAAWNAGVDTINIVPGSITGDKLAPGAVGTRELHDGAVTQAKLDPNVSTFPKGPAGGDLGSTYPNPTVVKAAGAFNVGDWLTVTKGIWFGGGTPGPIKTILDCSTPGIGSMIVNHAFAPQDATKSSWDLELDAGADAFRIQRRAPGGAVGSNVVQLGLDNTGSMFLKGSLVGGGAISCPGFITGRFMGGIKWDPVSPSVFYGTGWQPMAFPTTVVGGDALAPAGNNYLRSPSLAGAPRCYCLVTVNAMLEANPSVGGGVTIQLEYFNGSSWTVLSSQFVPAGGGGSLNASAVYAFNAGTDVRAMFGNWTGALQRFVGMFPTFTMVYLGTVP